MVEKRSFNRTNLSKKSKTPRVRNNFGTQLLSKIITLEHKTETSTKSFLPYVEEKRSEKRHKWYPSNHSETIVPVDNQDINICKEKNITTLVSQFCKLKQLLYNLKQLKQDLKIPQEKKVTTKQNQGQIVASGEMKVAGNDHFIKKKHKHHKSKKRKRRKKFGWMNLQISEPIGADDNVLKFEDIDKNMDSGIAYKASDAPLSTAESSQSLLSSSPEMTPRVVNNLRPSTSLISGKWPLDDWNQQKQSAKKQLSVGVGLGNKLVADELSYAAAQLNQQKLSALQTAQRNALLGRITSSTNYQTNDNFHPYYQDSSQYGVLTGQFPALNRRNSGFNYQGSFPFSMYKAPSWRSSYPMLNYWRYPYPLFRRRSFNSFPPWSYTSGVNYGSPMYGRFNHRRGFWGYLRSFEPNRRNFYDDDDNIEGLQYKDFDDIESNLENYKGDDDEFEDGGDNVDRRMKVSKSTQKALKKNRIKTEKSKKKDKVAVVDKYRNKRLESNTSKVSHSFHNNKVELRWK